MTDLARIIWVCIIAAHQLNRMPEALERLQQAADADPDDPYGYSMLGWLNYLDGRHEVAVEHFQHARQIAPHNAMILHNMSLPVEQVSGVVAAIRLLEEAARISPSQQKVQQRLSALRSQARAE